MQAFVEERSAALETYAGEQLNHEPLSLGVDEPIFSSLGSLPGGVPLPKERVRLSGLPRYEDLGLLGEGGMGEVRRVHDRKLGRTLALKTLHLPALQRPVLMARFLEEAQATAQLQHPGIVPVHDMGRLPDGRFWFTMKEVSGKTFSEVIQEVHSVSTLRWETARSGWNLHRLIDALRRVCEAVAYAHGRGVVHRDLKPQNVMVGDNDEVLVMDWGLARVLTESEPGEVDSEQAPVSTARSQRSRHTTLAGQVQGTPAYMPPEQARGDWDRVDTRSDVYALGSILYEVLSGQPPYQGRTAQAVLGQVLVGPPARLQRPGVALPQELIDVCVVAMARDPDRRYASAGELAIELAAWLSGAGRRERALKVVQEAVAHGPEADALRLRARALRAEAHQWMADVESWRPEEDKIPGWDKEEQAAELERQAERLEFKKEQLLQASLTHAPDLPEAHAALAHRYLLEHASAEKANLDSRRAEALLRHHLSALSDEHPSRESYQRYLAGDGTLTLLTDPPDARVTLYRQDLHHRRRVPHRMGDPVCTPLHQKVVSMGSYVCVVQHPDCAEVRYPIVIGRGDSWDGIAPGESAPTVLRLPRREALGPDDCVIPPGWFVSGGEGDGLNSLPRRRTWMHGLVFRRFPVTNREYLEFLDDLVAQGRTEEALRFAPRERSGKADEQGPLIYAFDGVHFSLCRDSDGDIWDLDWPVVMVDWWGASAFAEWTSVRTGQPWELPSELAWEKAARGVDGRVHPWGEGFDPSWACMRDSHARKGLPSVVDDFPVDESVYGVRGLGGNVREWCRDAFRTEGSVGGAGPGAADESGEGGGAAEPALYRVCRGGNWNGNAIHVRATSRFRGLSAFRSYVLGFRLSRRLI